MQYSRVLVQNWAETLENAVKLGVNTIEIEVAWNSHEPMPKRYEFDQNSKDLLTFINLVKHFKLFLIVRVDPYTYCSSHDLGGLPSWLLANKNLETNSRNSNFLLDLKDTQFRDLFGKYLDELFKFLAHHQSNQDGPIIGVLVQYFKHVPSESVFTFYDHEYVQFVESFMRKNDFYEILLTSRPKLNYNDDSQAASTWDRHIDIYLPVDKFSSFYSTLKSEKILEKAFLRNLMSSNCFGKKISFLKRNLDITNEITGFLYKRSFFKLYFFFLFDDGDFDVFTSASVLAPK